MPNDFEILEQKTNSRIKKLSPLLINQLAAGEVVTRPAAVVKELLENAIDAKATNIEVHITQGGMGIIQVVDNGVGIHSDDMVMAITRHATSKVADVANLHGINTLGFRGEALAATAAVSRLTLTSSDDDSGIGRQLQVAGILAEEPKLTPVLHSRGTTVTIKDLYFNVPARRGNLKSIATEFTHIETIVREVALARADVSLSLFHDNKKRLTLLANVKDHTNPANTTNNQSKNSLPITRLEQALGLSLVDNSLELTIDLSSLVKQLSEVNRHAESSQQALISGWLWPSAQLQPSLPKLIYVNGRLIKEPIISNQLRQLAASSNVKAMGYALHFELPMHWLNVNVHPSKQRIKISSLNNVMAHLSHAITSKIKSAVFDIDLPVALSSKLSEDDSSYKKIASITEPDFSYFDSQISSVKQAYQYPQIQSATSNTPDSSQADSLNDIDSTHESISANNYELADKKITNDQYHQALLATLPPCLEVISELTTLNFLSSDSLNSKELANSKKSLPWLLFYSQETLIIIKQSDWQQKFASLFPFSGYSQHNKTDNDLLSSQQVNQQMRRCATQMSTADLQAFITDITEILATNTVAQIGTKQLISLVISPDSA